MLATAFENYTICTGNISTNRSWLVRCIWIETFISVQ